MPTLTSISWCTHTDNDQAGCLHKQAGCRFCYAELLSPRMIGAGVQRYAGVLKPGGGWSGRVNVDMDVRRRIFRSMQSARKVRRVFYNSMSDTFFEGLDVDGPELTLLAELVSELFGQAIPAGLAPPHHLMLLTKRPERMLAWQRHHFPAGLPAGIIAMASMTSVQGVRASAAPMRDLKAACKGASFEPLVVAQGLEDEFVAELGKVIGTHNCLGGPGGWRGWGFEREWVAGAGEAEPVCPECEGVEVGLVELDDAGLNALDWWIVGGESGSSRLMDPDLLSTLHLAFEAYDAERERPTAWHFKQLGTALAGKLGLTDKGAHPAFWPLAMDAFDLPADMFVQQVINPYTLEVSDLRPLRG